MCGVAFCQLITITSSVVGLPTLTYSYGNMYWLYYARDLHTCGAFTTFKVHPIYSEFDCMHILSYVETNVCGHWTLYSYSYLTGDNLAWHSGSRCSPLDAILRRSTYHAAFPTLHPHLSPFYVFVPPMLVTIGLISALSASPRVDRHGGLTLLVRFWLFLPMFLHDLI